MHHKQSTVQVHILLEHMPLEHMLSARFGMEQTAPPNSLLHMNRLAHHSPKLGSCKHRGATADPSIVPQKQD